MSWRDAMISKCSGRSSSNACSSSSSRATISSSLSMAKAKSMVKIAPRQTTQQTATNRAYRKSSSTFVRGGGADLTARAPATARRRDGGARRPTRSQSRPNGRGRWGGRRGKEGATRKRREPTVLEEKNMCWVATDVRSLGDRVLFLGSPTGFAVDAAQLGVADGCAYFVCRLEVFPRQR
ncbi:hypothetical protein QYE76_006995 [Lolium multiflorum]|uniref:KIB1-4 beta-propeller domain-containing protein n=1 Tax=Lolium multiflorum TaxID=4521 RepID=A0AAD8RWQ5_LOLMU|nr:hypothetical protein QYE76_006995 [Lolium multiflorum]